MKDNLTKEQEFKLVQDVLAGNAEAFTAIYETHKKYISSVLYRIAGPDGLDDAVQDAFIRIFKNLSSFKGDAKLRTWMHRVAINTALMEKRTKQSKQASVTASLDEAYENANGDSVRVYEPGYEDRSFDRNTDQATIHKALARLPQMDQVVLKHWMLGDTDTQIATSEGWTLSAVKARLMRAKRRLRQAVLYPQMTFEEPMRGRRKKIRVEPVKAEPVRVVRRRRKNGSVVPKAKITERFCKCGCGTQIGLRGFPYAKGHFNPKTPKGGRLCKCGCGTEIASRGFPYAKGCWRNKSLNKLPARIHRTGQETPVRVIVEIVDIDAFIASLLNAKRESLAAGSISLKQNVNIEFQMRAR